MEDWAEIRRLYRAEGLSKAEIARRLEVSWNTVHSAVSSERPPKYRRPERGSAVDAFEPQIRALLSEYPKMPATVIAERIGWARGLSILKDRLQVIRPEYRGVDPADRLVFEPGRIAQMDLWFPPVKIPVGCGQERTLPVLVMALGYSRMIDAVMLPSRQGGDLLTGMWRLLSSLGAIPRQVVWDREAAIAGTGKPTTLAAGFFGTLACGLKIAPARDPEYKGIVERANGYLETSFMPGRKFTSPADFNAQLEEWLPVANQRRVRRLHGRPAEFLAEDRAAMIPLPVVTPRIGLTHRVRLARDYYLRVDSNDYSVDPRYIGRFIDAVASEREVVFRHDGQVIGTHERSWASQQTITDPAHVQVAAGLRARYQTQQRISTHRRHTDGHPVQIRALTDYDRMFGIDFQATPDHPQEGASSS